MYIYMYLEKSDSSDFDHGIPVDTIQVCLSISKQPISYDFHAQKFIKFTQNSLENKSKQQKDSNNSNCLFDERHQKWMARCSANKKATVTHITILYSCYEQKDISKCKTHCTLRLQQWSNKSVSTSVSQEHEGYIWHRLTKTGKLKMVETSLGQMKLDFCKYQFFRFRICQKQHKSMVPTCLMSRRWCAGVGNVFLGPLMSNCLTMRIVC